MNKRELRHSLLDKRDNADIGFRAEADSRILDRLLSMIHIRNIKNVLTYVSFRSEADTRKLIASCFDAGINIYAPRVVGEDMVFCHVRSFNDLQSGYKGILEPAKECPPWKESSFDADGLEKDTVLIVPGAVFDRNNRRIGYGGGYYDRFIAAHPGLFSVGICYSFQIVDDIPSDAWDRSVDMIVSD